MTGSETSSSFSSKSWNGVDGKYYGGQLAWNPWTCYNRQGSATPGKADQWWNSQYMGYLFGNEAVFGNNDTIELLGKLANAARGHQFNLGVAVGEGKESVQLVLSTLSRFHQGIRALKKGDLAKCARALGVQPPRKRKNLGNSLLTTKDVSGLWLEMQYGWRPLIQDVYESHKAFVELTQAPRKTRFHVSHSVKAQYAQSNSYARWDNPSSCSRRVTCELVEELGAGRSLGLLNPASVAWELVPFSFVADWFTPIGDYLDALSIIPHLNARVMYTERMRYTCNIVGLSVPYYGATSRGTATRCSRGLLAPTVPMPQFIPLGDVYSPGRLKNSVALLHQLVS